MQAAIKELPSLKQQATSLQQQLHSAQAEAAEYSSRYFTERQHRRTLHEHLQVLTLPCLASFLCVPVHVQNTILLPTHSVNACTCSSCAQLVSQPGNCLCCTPALLLL